MSSEEYTSLEERGVIGTRPIQYGHVPGVLTPDERIDAGRWSAYDPEFATHIREGLGPPP